MAAQSLCRELLIKVGFGTIACKVWGENIPATEKFLALHGWLDNAGSFDPLMQHFSTKDRCIACVDLPGHGISSHLPRGIPYSPADDLQGIRAAVKHLGWKKYNIIGHSMGAMRAQQYMMCYPEETKSVLALDGFVIPVEAQPGAPFRAFGGQVDKYLKFTSEYHHKDREHTWQELSDRWRGAVPGLTEENFTVLMKRGSRKLDNGSYIYTRDAALHNRTNAVLMHTMDTILESMKKCTGCPMLFIVSTLNQWEMGEEQKKKMEVFIERLIKEHPSKVERAVFEGYHHFHMQKPEEVSNILNDFLLRSVKQDSSVTNEDTG